MNNLPGMAGDYANLGQTFLQMERMDEAEEMFRKALPLDTELGRQEEQGNHHTQLGLLAFRRGDLRAAEVALENALECYRGAGADPQAAQTGKLLVELRARMQSG